MDKDMSDQFNLNRIFGD